SPASSPPRVSGTSRADDPGESHWPPGARRAAGTRPDAGDWRIPARSVGTRVPDLAYGIQRGPFGPALRSGRQAPVVVEQGRQPVAISWIGQHPPTLAKIVPVLLDQRLPMPGGVGLDLDEIAQLIAKLHEYPVAATDQLATALLVAAGGLSAVLHLQALAQVHRIIGDRQADRAQVGQARSPLVLG